MAEGQIPIFRVPTTPEAIDSPEDIWSEFFGSAEEMHFIINDLRHRHAAVLEQDGEPFYWMKRKLDGAVCPYWDLQAGNCREPLNVDATCYNTKYLGGYEYPLVIKLGLPSPTRSTAYQEGGLMKLQPMKPWTLWVPHLMDRDLVINVRTGQRYEVLNVTETGPWRGMFIIQNFDMRVLQKGTDFGVEVPVVAPGL